MKKKLLIGLLAATVMMAMPVFASDLEEKVADLEQRVAKLEAMLGIATSDEDQDVTADSSDAASAKTGNVYKIGETWTVPGLWSITVDGVTEVEDRNSYDEREPAAVYLVDFSYENLGYEDDFMDGLYVFFDSFVDSEGSMGYEYPGDITYYPLEVPVGSKCDKAQVCVGVEHAGSFSMRYSDYVGDEKYDAVFEVDVK